LTPERHRWPARCGDSNVIVTSHWAGQTIHPRLRAGLAAAHAVIDVLAGLEPAHRIAVIPGDEIGTEVVPEGLRVLDAVAAAFDLSFEYAHFDHSSADYYRKHGKMLPDNWFDELAGFEAIFFGASDGPTWYPTTSRCGAACSFAAPSTNTSTCVRSNSCLA
jgi:hypothetical protein